MPKTRDVQFTPAFDKRHADPEKNYGIGAVEIRFILKGVEGAVQFVCYTNWYTQGVVAEKGLNLITSSDSLFKPHGFDLGYHSPTPDRGYSKLPCSVLEQGYCYYDGSSLAADNLVDVLIAEGSDGVWKELESYYTNVFES